jgi:hypothetical protein
MEMEKLTEEIRKIIREQKAELETMTPTDKILSVLFTLALTEPGVVKKDNISTLIKRILREEDVW